MSEQERLDLQSIEDLGVIAVGVPFKMEVEFWDATANSLGYMLRYRVADAPTWQPWRNCSEIKSRPRLLIYGIVLGEDEQAQHEALNDVFVKDLRASVKTESEPVASVKKGKADSKPSGPHAVFWRYLWGKVQFQFSPAFKRLIARKAPSYPLHSDDPQDVKKALYEIFQVGSCSDIAPADFLSWLDRNGFTRAQDSVFFAGIEKALLETGRTGDADDAGEWGDDDGIEEAA